MDGADSVDQITVSHLIDLNNDIMGSLDKSFTPIEDSRHDEHI